MAALPQCFSYHCCIESLGKLPPKGFGQHTVNVSAILRILLWIVCLAARAVGSTWATGAARLRRRATAKICRRRSAGRRSAGACDSGDREGDEEPDRILPNEAGTLESVLTRPTGGANCSLDAAGAAGWPCQNAF